MIGPVLVTGATGFVGAALCRALLKDGRKVAAALRQPGAVLPAGVEPRVVGEIGPDTDWRPALAGIAVVVHAAARVHQMHETAADALSAYRRVNTYGTARLAEACAAACAAAGGRRLVFISSIKAMGDGNADGTPYREDQPCAPTDAYGRSKAEAEAALAGVAGDRLETVILRPPLVYGPGARGNFPALLRLSDSPWPLPLGGIDNRRSLLALDNLVDAILRAIEHPAAAGRTFLVSDGEDLSTSALVARLRRALGRPERLFALPGSWWRAMRHVGPLAGAVGRLTGSLAVDAAAIRRDLGWRPPVAVDRALAQVAAAWRRRSSVSA
ncbi:MAG: NAD-dependent epimerase/dehydratase family protein [Alphaproteobacteria bacterium]|nr:NAD-dependent epimerase/dehydratase family protein [Alphaproteobacteria bacterium]